MEAPAIGDQAPHFTAEGTGATSFQLSATRGQPLVLVFYPGDGTPVCTAQLKSYSAEFADFEALEATVWALSPQDLSSHEAFRARHDFAFPLLVDQDKRIGASYGVVGPLGFYRRCVVVLDRDGAIRFYRRSAPGFSYPKAHEIVDALKGL